MKLTRITVLATLFASLTAGTFAADPAFKLKVRPYPLEVCVVSDEKLGSMGDPVVLVEGNQEIQLCCKNCTKDFQKNKKANLAKIEAGWKKVKTYPLSGCIVSDEKLDPEKAVGAVVEGREFHFCCKSCLKDFKKDTAKFIKKFDEAARKKS
ncbi:MAG: hypothetical protein Q7T30_01540 [Planctomycetota bacterium]|nr:hypothetical protein [Planctomycetota bacterium]